MGTWARRPSRSKRIRRAPSPSTSNTCSQLGRARLSCRRAAELFEEATANAVDGPWTLHQLRHSALTHAAEDGANTSTLLAYSGHTPGTPASHPTPWPAGSSTATRPLGDDQRLCATSPRTGAPIGPAACRRRDRRGCGSCGSTGLCSPVAWPGPWACGPTYP